MERKEKVELILEQMRLCLATKDYIRTQIIAKKINIRFFEKEEQQALKLKFYEYMIELDQHEGTYLNICKHFRAIFDTPCVQVSSRNRQDKSCIFPASEDSFVTPGPFYLFQEDEPRKLMTMRNVALYIILSPFDNEQSDLIQRILKEKTLEKIPVYKSLLEQFVNMELIDQVRYFIFITIFFPPCQIKKNKKILFITIF